MNDPTLLDFGRFNGALDGISLSDSWRIATLKSDDVIWNIVLAYLNSFDASNENELTRRITCLTSDGKVNENIRKSVQMYNPFLHRNACFNDKVMSELVSAFKDRVEDCIRKYSIFTDWEKNCRYLEASSNLLCCNIAFIHFPIKNKIIGNVFPILYSSKFYITNEREMYEEHIKILAESIPISSNGCVQMKFSFCVPKKIGLQKRTQGLIEILKRNRIIDNKEMIQEINRLPDVSDNIVISLLKSDFGHIIPFIYGSPYVLSKLADACFETDPRTKDSAGKSAFFHAFKTEQSHLVSLLYDYASNASSSLTSDSSVRSPTHEIVKNLRNLKDCLEQLGKNLESEEITEKSRCLFRCLCRFNEFQIELCENINNINTRIDYAYHNEKEREVLKRKKTMLAIINTYKSYFDYADGDSAGALNLDSKLFRFRNFFEHGDYYDKLDFSSAIMFFDNLFLLKERLILPNNVYLDVESTFFLFMFCRKNLEQYEKQERFYSVSRWITFQERLSFQKQLCSFLEILEKTEANIVNKIPESTVKTLTNLPEIYGQFIIFRLQHYLNAATEMTVKDLNSILVIERCLVIVGESCKVTDFNSVQRIITLALPKDFIKCIKKIRNRLAGIKSHDLLYRNNLEEDVELFKGIQNELIKLKKFLLPIYSIHKHEIDQFLLFHSAKYVSKARRSILKKHENELKDILPSLEMEKNQLSTPTSSCQHPWKHYFDDTKTKINELNRERNILDISTSSCYKYLIQNMVSAVEVVLNDLKAPVTEKAVAEMDSHFWCLESFLSYITKDQNLAGHRRTLRLLLKNRKSLFTEWMKNKSTNSVIDETLVADGKYLPTTMNPIDTFVKYGSFIDLESSSFTFSNENENSETNQVENETNGENFENGVSENVYDSNINTETIDTKARKEDGDLRESSEDPETINLEKYLPLTEAINLPSCDGWLSITDYPVNVEAENVYDGSIMQEMFDAKECKEAELLDPEDLLEDPETAISTEENDLHTFEASNTSREEWLLFNVYHNYPVNDEVEGPPEIMDVKRKTIIEYSVTFLDDYAKFADTIFQEFPYDSTEEFCFKNFKKFCRILKGWIVLNRSEKEYIIQRVPKQFQNVPELKRKVIGLLRDKTYITKEIEDELSKLKLKNKEIKEITENIKLQLIDDAVHIVDSARDYFSDLKVMMEAKEIDKGECELLCKKLEIPDDAKDILLKLVPGLNQKVPGNILEFLRNRIIVLKNILIDESNTIQQLWEKATTPRRKMHVKEKIVQLYLNDSEIQASAEMLLLDCLNILKSKGLKNLVRKTTNLLNGVNLRNVLAHGHPLLESLGRLIDPTDLPSELVEKMLTLISDENVISCIQQISERAGIRHKSFMDILHDEQFTHLSEQILECDHYEEYASLVHHHRNIARRTIYEY